MDRRELNIYRSILADKKIEIERLKSKINNMSNKPNEYHTANIMFISGWLDDLIADYNELSEIICIYEQQEKSNEQ